MSKKQPKRPHCDYNYLLFRAVLLDLQLLSIRKKEKLNKGDHLVHAPDTAASIKWLCHCNFHSFTLFAPVFDHRHILKSNLVYQALFTETLTFGTGTTRSLD